jgi:hypothetical protein
MDKQRIANAVQEGKSGKEANRVPVEFEATGDGLNGPKISAGFDDLAGKERQPPA